MWLGLAGVKALQIGKLIAFGKSYAPPPETISSAVAHEEQWQNTLTAVGSIDRGEGRDGRPGSRRHGDGNRGRGSGAVVAKGDLLLRLDTSTEEAQLRAAEAQTELARLNAERTQTLRKDNTVSQSELDTGGGDVQAKPGQRRRHPRDH